MALSPLHLMLLGLAMYLPFAGIKRSLYRLMGARIHRSVYIAPDVSLKCTDMRRVRMDAHCSLGLGTSISCECIEMDEDSKIAAGVRVCGKASVKLGRSVYLGHNVLLDCWNNVLLEDRVQLGPGAMILTHDSSNAYIRGAGITSAEAIVREDSYIGAGAIVLPGVEIGPRAIVGAGAVVTRHVPAGTTVVGVPARPQPERD
jgi:UDP-2-acetamido-3-amino-2,3-dideoxy-glucuronate N-acetyltransferase